MYALIGIGLTLIFGVMRIIQYAHGEFYMLGAFALYYFCTQWGVPYWIALVLAVVIIFWVSVGVELLLFRPLHGKDILYTLAVGMGLIFICESGGIICFGPKVRGIESGITGGIKILGGFLSYERIVISIFSALVIIGLWFFLQKTRIGMAVRAVAEDPEVSSLQGINPLRIHWIGFGIGSAMAALSGCLLGTLLSIKAVMGFEATVKAFMVVIVGGLGSVGGALLGGFMLGFIDSFGTTLVNADVAYIMGFLIIFLILIFKPSGFFGQEWE